MGSWAHFPMGSLENPRIAVDSFRRKIPVLHIVSEGPSHCPALRELICIRIYLNLKKKKGTS